MDLLSLPQENYYANMYDIENLTYINSHIKGKRKVSKKIRETEDLIRNNSCREAKQKLQEIIEKNPEEKQAAFILYGALIIKDYVLEGENTSPKNSALSELREYLGLPAKDIEKKMLIEVPVKEAWEKFNPDPENEKDIDRFYMETDAYIYELMTANHIVQTLYAFYVLTKKTEKLNIKRILDFGGGAGTLSILFRKLGYEIIYADLPGKTFDFAKRRFAKRDLDIPMMDLKNSGIEKESFDCILCTEVIEHLVNPVSTLKKFSENLKKGQTLIVSESCEYTEEFASHLEHNKKYGGENFIETLYKLNLEHIMEEPYIPQMIFRKF